MSTDLPSSPDDNTALHNVFDCPCTREQRWVFEHAFIIHHQYVRGAAFTNAAQHSLGADETRRHYRERGQYIIRPFLCSKAQHVYIQHTHTHTHTHTVRGTFWLK